MKIISFQGIILGFLILSIYSCESRDDSIKINATSSTSKEKVIPLTCKKLFNSPEDFVGQVINLDAICWGSSHSVDGKEILMSLDDQKSVGLQQAHVLVHFTKDQADEIQNIKENDSISLTAKVSTLEFGALRLIEAKVTPN